MARKMRNGRKIKMAINDMTDGIGKGVKRIVKNIRRSF